MTDLRFAGVVEIMTVQTNATGSNWVDFASNPCDALDIVNNTGAAIEYRRSGTGSSIQIPNGGSRLVAGVKNSNEISVRRVDLSNTQVTLTAEAITS